MNININVYAWYIDITSNKRLAIAGYPIEQRDGVCLCSYHADMLESEEDVIPDPQADTIKAASYCWVCE